jgi:tetratricopeptide (TPR) repeat protein
LFQLCNTTTNKIIYSEQLNELTIDLLKQRNTIFITKEKDVLINNHKCFLLTETDYYIYVDDNLLEDFIKVFYYYYIGTEINGIKILNFDNLINLCIMVKNGGPQFEQMLIDNYSIIDRWTILDTGSTDGTIEIINKVLVGKKEGNLYQEPFINFRDSRNRLLDLAGKECKYIIMLDDTYVVKGKLREFLTEVRSDQYSNSFTLFIHSDDTKYGSNRIIESASELRYIHKIHEVINDKNNINVVIPEDQAFIFDKRFDYMEKRTNDRKQLDLKLLYEEIEENPNDPRAYYYLAQTYNCLDDHEKAFFYFMKRCEFTNSGFIQERVDAAFEAARIANFKLNKSWDLCEDLYLKAFKIDESRPESLYFIGIHYYLEGNNNRAFYYFKRGFEIGFPSHCQYSLKPTLSYHFLPKFLSKICYQLEEYVLGEEVSKFFIMNNSATSDDYQEIVSWYNIFVKLNIYKGPKKIINSYDKPLFVFVADGGFNQWTGSNILTTGVGGSETYIIEMARYIQQSGNFQTIVFCNTPNGSEEIFENTIYKPLTSYYEFINTTYVNTCIISRFSEYLPVTFKGFSENVYLVVHDLTPSGIVIPMDKKLKNIFCLTEWHVEYMTNIFPQLKNITVPFYYGCNSSSEESKIPYKFIYSSFPNRGLLQLLQMWEKIYKKEPMATLHIYSDVDNEWSNRVEGEKMQQIRELLNNYRKEPNGFGIHYHGWVKKSVLEESWKTADIWFYPCTFMETFCLTALEAAKSKTFVITNDLAALQNTVGNRGCIINGDPTTKEWQEIALEQVYFYMDEKNKGLKEQFINSNYQWSVNLSWKEQANKLLNEYILPNSIIEYKGMHNWTNDLPFGNKQYFLDILQYFNQTYPKVLSKEKINILEIGTYTGISLINIINSVPNSVGIGVDMWSSYNENNLLENMDSLGVEKSFYKNISTVGLENRITGIKSDSTDALTQFLKVGSTFDFIYVDGSHLLLDCYSDLVLAWIILEKSGILAIDDYTYKYDSMLDSPFEAVNHFLKRYEGKYKLLHKAYRVFLQKL